MNQRKDQKDFSEKIMFGAFGGIVGILLFCILVTIMQQTSIL